MKTKPRVTVMMLGLRSPYSAQGGIEAHVRELTLHLTPYVSSIEIVCRKAYHPKQMLTLAPDIQCTALWSPKSAYLEAIVHTLIGVIYAGIRRPQVLHIHGIGPALAAPIAKLLGLRVVVTHHGLDYQREKWPGYAKRILKLGEYCAAKYSDARICVARALSSQLSTRYRKKFEFIPNGASKTLQAVDDGILSKLGITSGRYILSVGRIVPEKRQDDLIAAVSRIEDPDVRLVLVGAADHASRYASQVQKMAACDNRVVLAGQQTGLALHTLFQNAGVFALPSSHEGLPIALLEAMGYGLPLVISDIPVLLDMKLEGACYVALGDPNAIAQGLQKYLRNDIPVRVNWSTALEQYDWANIAATTAELYQPLLKLSYGAR